MARVVWVLGAGFSAGLGGPLLNELLSEHAIKEVKLRFRHKPKATCDMAQRMVRIYPKGLEVGMWRDAEEFLDYGETARTDNVRAQLLRDFDSNLNEYPQQWANGLKQFVAARVCAFLENANLASELWAPYIRWARALTQDDTVITFNWDRGPERIAEYLAMPLQTIEARFAKLAPSKLTEKSFERGSQGVARVLKLHGSVDWKAYGDHYALMGDPLFALDCEGDQIAIATPGPGKLSASESFLKPLWQEAIEALARAQAVVFLGYRFPPSDSQARELLLSALSVAQPGTFRAIHTVLGPAIHNDQSARLRGLLVGMLEGTGWCDTSEASARPLETPRYLISQHPLYGQDFMSVFSRDRLIEPRTLVPPKKFSWP